MKALFLIAEGFDDLELFYPWFRLREEGIEVTLAGPSRSPVTGEHGYRINLDLPLHQVNPSDYEMLILPGGKSPEGLRLCEEAVDLTRTFMDEDRYVLAICHGPQLLISAGSLQGKSATCAAGIRDDLRMAGATYRDEPVVIDGNLLTSRGVQDLPILMQKTMALLRVQT